MLKKSFLALTAAAGLVAAGDMRIADAAQQGNKDVVKTLLKDKADVNAAQGDGMTALHWAASKDDLELVKSLLAAGANPNAKTRIGEITPLFLACTNGDAAMIQAMLNAGADAKSVKANGTTALMMAATSGGADAVKVLLDKGADVNAKENAHGQTAIMFASALNRASVVKLLTSRGAQLDLETSVRKLERVRFDQDGNIVDDKAAAKKGEAVKAATPEAEQLNVFARSIGFESAEYKIDTAAAEKNQYDVFAKSVGFKEVAYNPAKKVAKAGDIGFRGPRKVGPDFAGGMTALIYAVREGHMDAVKVLVEAGANVNHVSGGDKMSPIVEAIINGHLDIAKYLLDKGADPNLVGLSGLAPLYATIDVQWAPKAWFPQPSVEQEKTTHLELMKALLDKGANVNTQVGEKLWFRSFTNDYTWVDPAGATAFWRAAQSGDVPAMKLLLEHGADPKLANKALETPLHAAAGIGWAWNWTVRAPFPPIDAVKLCVEQGNDVNAQDNRGYTPLHGAAFLGDNDMINYLVSKGAKTDLKSRSGDSIADMANGPTRFGQPHAETVALLEKLGSPNSHNCRSDQCVIASKSDIYDRKTPEDYDQIARMDAFAKSVGFASAVYSVDAPNFRGAARPGGSN
ncbi:MAG: ankyrin repeat domain-containing protein [Acidobacteriia bacterium]|nr:ankyrin repeat domain-containing protein [Terriglobia bacterium]